MGATPAQTDAKKAAFLAAFEGCGTIRGAAAASGVADTTHYAWLEKDAEYFTRFEAAQRKSAKAMEAEARRRAIEGVRRLKFDKNGEPLIDPATGEPYVEVQYSDTMLIFLLKCNDPAKFGDKVEQTHKGDADNPVSIYQLPDNGRD